MDGSWFWFGYELCVGGFILFSEEGEDVVLVVV